MCEELGLLILIVGIVPYIVEVIYQFPLQKRFYSALPQEVLEKLPQAPKSARFLFLAPTRLTVALWKYILDGNTPDSEKVRHLKSEMRMSLYRELVFMALGIGVALFLYFMGWTPPTPF